MASTREIRRRIKSVKSTAQITHAMQLVAAAKMRKAQQAALAGKAYGQTLASVLHTMAGKIDPAKHQFLVGRESGDTAALVFSSDRGLAGALNTNLFREAEKLPQEVHYITIGKKGRDYIVKRQRTLEADFETIDKPDFLLAKKLAKLVLDDYKREKLKQVVILYTEFVNTLTQKPKVVQLLPLNIDQLVRADEQQTQEFLFEPNIDVVLENILNHYIEITLYQAVLEAQASEHSARMIAMKNATDNANDLVLDLTLAYNQLRQDAITKELLEITTAALALS